MKKPESTPARRVIGHRKGRWSFGRRVRGSGAPPTKHYRRRFEERPQDRCERHHAYRAGCGCGKAAV